MKKEIDPALMHVITHFWNQRGTARTMLQGNAGIAIARLLVCRLEDALLKLWSAHPSPLGAPVSLIAEQLQLALLLRWLAGRESASL